MNVFGFTVGVRSKLGITSKLGSSGPKSPVLASRSVGLPVRKLMKLRALPVPSVTTARYVTQSNRLSILKFCTAVFRIQSGRRRARRGGREVGPRRCLKSASRAGGNSGFSRNRHWNSTNFGYFCQVGRDMPGSGPTDLDDAPTGQLRARRPAPRSAVRKWVQMRLWQCRGSFAVTARRCNLCHKMAFSLRLAYTSSRAPTCRVVLGALRPFASLLPAL